jgi:anti-sigma regulatory factor (Ser/Thr protein kinase)
MSHTALRDEVRAAEAWTSFNLPGGPDAASRARALIEPLRSELGDDLHGDLTLMLSEVVTNAHRHGGAGEAGIGVDVEVTHDRLRAEVSDAGRGFKPEPVPEEERGAGGWGLVILDRLADRWGVRSGPPSCVWFEVARAG